MKGFNKYYLMNKAHLGILTTKIIFASYIQSKFLYHIIVFDNYSENQKKTLEMAYSNQIKKAFKFPKFIKPDTIRQFFGFITLE